LELDVKNKNSLDLVRFEDVNIQYFQYKYAELACAGYASAMPLHIECLKSEFNYREAYRLAQKYLLRMVNNDCVGVVTKYSVNKLVKQVITLFSHSRIMRENTWINDDEIIQCIQKAYSVSMINEKTMNEAYETRAAVKKHREKYLIV
jgi:hypothetical protein